MRFSFLAVASAGIAGAYALSAAEWRAQSVYQILTDRFAVTSGAYNVPCVPADGVYCGGTWQGIISHLDYIQDMGFTAVSSRSVKTMKIIQN